jgi:pilus assembly protein CpaB
MAVRLAGGFPIKTGYIFIGLALIFSIATAVMIKNVATNKTSKQTVTTETKEVAVAAVTLPAGATITADDVRMLPWPEKYLPKSSVFTSVKDLVGRTVRSDLIAGEPVFTEKLAGDRSLGGMPVLIPKGYRAVSIGVTEVKGVAGFVKPGDRVDVLATFEVKGKDDEDLRVTKTVLQDVLVMASAQQMIREDLVQKDTPAFLTEEEKEKAKDDKKKKKKEKSDKEIEKEKKERAKERKEQEKRAKTVTSVTLALNPEQAERLALAEEAGEVRLVLRAEGDQSVADLVGITDRELLTSGTLPEGKEWPFKFMDPSNAAPPPPVAPTAVVQAPAAPMPMMPPPVVRPAKTVEFIEGTEKTSVEF